MAISKKNKSRAIVDGKEYLWWIFEEVNQTEFDGIQIKAVCSDQSHFFKYGLQQEEANRKLVLSLNNYSKLVHLTSPPKFENDEGIITKSGIIRIIQWFKSGDYQVEYALDEKDNDLTILQKKTLLSELQKIVN